MIGGASLFAKLKHLRKEKDGRIYVRRNGRSVRIAAAPGTDDFLTEYGKALEALGRGGHLVATGHVNPAMKRDSQFFGADGFTFDDFIVTSLE